MTDDQLVFLGVGVLMIIAGLVTPWAMEDYVNIPYWGAMTMLGLFVLSGIVVIVMALTGLIP
jgi:hypothetical protein